jgi:hypothetical protein
MVSAPVKARLIPPPEAGAQAARLYAQRLLDALGIAPLRAIDLPDEHPALAWARSGLMALTGPADGAPQMCPLPLAACADGALAALAALAPAGVFADLRGSRLLAERAQLAGHARSGPVSPGGSCRLLEAADGVLALSLARDDDWALLPAWLEAEVPPDWEPLARAVRDRSAQTLVERGHELGLAVANALPGELVGDPVFPPSPRRRESSTKGAVRLDSRLRGNDKPPLVVDLSSLWAGPLCSRLLQRCGAEVIKVESVQRPDGARRGPAAFFERLNAGKRCVTLDFSTRAGRGELRELLQRADIVIEGSRPRALRQLGILAEEVLAEDPGLTWISLTGYGRGGVQENWIAYGDDAAVAAGLSQVQFQATGQWMFVGDAIADPLTGLHAALAAWAGHLAGGGGLVSLALRDVVAHCIAFDLPAGVEALRERQRAWASYSSPC